jgi:hypothetical protein
LTHFSIVEHEGRLRALGDDLDPLGDVDGLVADALQFATVKIWLDWLVIVIIGVCFIVSIYVAIRKSS